MGQASTRGGGGVDGVGVDSGGRNGNVGSAEGVGPVDVPPARRSFRKSLRRRLSGRSRRPALSHTFSFATVSENADLVNINIATEELLMTLPGISRRIAQSIVEHRQLIGRFRKIDDVALVPGMGAERLNMIRPEICIRKMASIDSSRTQSLDSIGSSDSIKTQINVNTASVFQLQCVVGLNQELAAKIVEYRERKGSFKSVDDLIKVKGMDKIRLGSIKTQLSTCPVIKFGYEMNFPEKVETPSDDNAELLNTPVQNKSLPNGTLKNGSVPGFGLNGHRQIPPVPHKYPSSAINGFSLNSVNDIFDLLSVFSRRPFLEEDFKYTRNGKTAIRLATWNLHRLDKEKANNPGFREVVCRTILENRLSIIGIQDIFDEEALKVICDDLNTPILRRVIEWKDNSRQWQYYFMKTSTSNSKNIGFIFETSNNNIHIQVHTNSNIEIERVESEESIFNYGYSDFKVNESCIGILNVQLMKTNLDYSKALLCDKIDKLLNVNKKVIIIGDFYSTEHVKDFATCYEPVIKPETSTLVEVDGGKLVHDGISSILIAGEDISQYTGVAGVIRGGLCHLAIPRGWTWGGPSSPFCPVWAEFYIE